MASQTPHQNVSFPSEGQTAHGYLALPEGGKGPGVIVIQEWWGLTDHIRDVADRLAAEGFVALAPDLFGGAVAHDGAEAAEMMSKLPEEVGAKLLAGAVDYLLGQEAVTSSTVGTIGFCMGGGFVLALAAQQGEKISAAVPFYGVGQGVPDSYAGVRAKIQGHYANEDSSYPVEQAHAQEEQIRARIRDRGHVLLLRRTACLPQRREPARQLPPGGRAVWRGAGPLISCDRIFPNQIFHTHQRPPKAATEQGASEHGRNHHRRC